MRRSVLQLVCAALTVSAALAATVTVQPNSCVIPTFTITDTPTTYGLNFSAVPGTVGTCSAQSLLCDLLALSPLPFLGFVLR